MNGWIDGKWVELIGRVYGFRQESFIKRNGGEVEMLASYGEVMILFLTIGLGWLLTKKGIFTMEMSDAFSFFILKIALPLDIFIHVTKHFSRKELSDLLHSGFFPVVVLLVLFALSFILRKMLHVAQEDVGVFSLLFTTSSTIFFGLPLCLALIGSKAVPYALWYYVCYGLFIWTIGVTLVNRDRQTMTHTASAFEWKSILKSILNPPFLSFLFGLIFVLLKVPILPLAAYFCTYIGATASPLAMLFTGILIGGIGLRHLIFTKEVGGILLGRYVIAPIVVLILYKVLPVSSMMAKVCFIQASLPIANAAVVLVEQKKANTTLATASLSYSIIVYLFICPVLIWVMNDFIH